MLSAFRGLLCCLTLLGALTGLSATARADADRQAREIFEATGVRGGVVVHLGCGTGELTAALRATDAYIVHGLDTDAVHVAQARQAIADKRLSGPVSVSQLQGTQLPYVDNMVNLLVAEDLGEVSLDEVLRVLVPEGVAYVRDGDTWTKTVKPRPDNIDDWTHYLHDPSGNAVAHDDVVGPPRHLQWQGSPRWSRHHDRMASMSALVSEGGRLIYVMDEGSRISIQTPSDWKLIARDAFNGTILWKRQIEDWQHHLWPLKSGPTQLARRLVAVDGRVYCTLKFESPLHVLDAASGETIMTLEDSASTEEILVDGGVIFALVNKGESELTNYKPAHNTGDQARVAREWKWNEQPREIHAYDAESGELIWSQESVVAPLTIALDANRLIYHDGQKIVARDRSTGETVWETGPAGRRSTVEINFGPRLVIYEDTVLYAGGDRRMSAYDAATGKPLWEAPHESSGYKSPEDLLVVGGLVWSWPTTSGRQSGELTGHDPRTGEIKSKFAPNIDTYWFHHRCYIAKATDKYLMPSRTGIEFVDFANENWDIHHWVRGGCLYGVMPANGLTYAPPHNCACYPEAKLYGFNALAAASPARDASGILGTADRLHRGPAYPGDVPTLNEAVRTLTSDVGPARSGADWPMFRHDTLRSGVSPTTLPAKLDRAWDTNLGGRLTGPVIAGDTLVVAQIDEHTVHALDAGTGERRWSYIAGGRVDSPPTLAGGNVYFGCADGWVYCLRQSDGEVIWRFRAAPRDLRLMAFEQLESVWPVHGSVLVQDNEVSFVAGRSNFLDGGLRMIKLSAGTGEVLSEKIIDDKDPRTGEPLQNHVKTLQMPVGLPDVLSSDGSYVYMRSQKFDLDGNRLEIGPNSGDTVEQTMNQGGDGAHLFAPMGYLDDTWFHRSYWVYGKSFAGGHNGYYQAGRFAPSGRLLVFDDETVYGYGRKPEYLKWTTTIEHQLFATSREAPEVPDELAKRRGRAAPAGSKSVTFDDARSLDVSGKGIAFEAWVNAARPNGVIMARGGAARGVALQIKAGKPVFHVREGGQLHTLEADRRIVGRWAHVIGAVTADGTLKVYVDGDPVAEMTGKTTLRQNPREGVSIGDDAGSDVADYGRASVLTGIIDEARMYVGDMTDEFAAERFADNDAAPPGGLSLALACSFDGGKIADASPHRFAGVNAGANSTGGRYGEGMQFAGGAGGGGGGGGPQNRSFVEWGWAQDVPVYVRSMVKAGETLFVCGPPDLINEEQTLEQIIAGQKAVEAQLVQQDEALKGAEGSLLLAVDTRTGKTLATYDVDALPSWDAMAAAGGSLFLTTMDGRVLSWRGGE
jgi:outer membrane protein assembly factor BamB